MPRTCTICSHQLAAEIDDRLVAGQTNRRIAAQFKLSEAAVRRHRADYLPYVWLSR